MKKILKVLIVILLVIWIIFIGVDYIKYKNNKKPIFAFFPVTYLDGGTTEYLGLGYKVIYFNRIDDEQLGNEFKYMGPIWVDYDYAYDKCKKEAFSDTYKDLNNLEDKGTYNILKKVYSNTEEIDKIFIEKKNDETGYYLKLIDIYNQNELNDEDKKWLYDGIKYYYAQNMNSMDDTIKGKFDIFFFGMDYTGIDY